jgi:hypothetical protein
MDTGSRWVVLGDPRLGAVLRGLRTGRGLTRDGVAARISCAPSLVSQVESGARALHPWLAQDLDRVYGTGTTITALVTSGAYRLGEDRATLGPGGDVVLVGLPEGDVMVPVSRRTLLTALGIGASGASLAGLHEAAAGVPADDQVLAGLRTSFTGLRTAGRFLPPQQLVDPLTGQVGLLHVLLRRAPRALRRDYLVLQAQHADYLSWMVQEAGDPTGSLYWIDRAHQWADQAGWPAMTAYTHVRRSTLASTCAGDGPAAVEHAQRALRAGPTLMVQAQATKQIAYGHALAGNPDASQRALEQTASLHTTTTAAGEDSDPAIGPTSVDVSVMLAQFRATCDVYLGGGEDAIAALSSYRTAYGPKARRGAITSARLARAHAQAGDPDQACALAIEALETGQALDSWTTRTELHRALAPLRRWPAREDVTDVRHRITALT